jgi:hypothetical protein
MRVLPQYAVSYRKTGDLLVLLFLLIRPSLTFSFRSFRPCGGILAGAPSSPLWQSGRRGWALVVIWANEGLQLDAESSAKAQDG